MCVRRLRAFRAQSVASGFQVYVRSPNSISISLCRAASLGQLSTCLWLSQVAAQQAASLRLYLTAQARGCERNPRARVSGLRSTWPHVRLFAPFVRRLFAAGRSRNARTWRLASVAATNCRLQLATRRTRSCCNELVQASQQNRFHPIRGPPLCSRAGRRPAERRGEPDFGVPRPRTAQRPAGPSM